MYDWDGMQKVSYELAIALFLNEVVGVYKLYDDGTEGLIEDVEELEKHNSYDGEFGCDKEDIEYIKRMGF